MSEELIRCPCCEKLVPANNIELSFKKPDDVAVLDEDELEKQCKINDDLCACEEEYYYVRCILPLSIHDKGSDYCLGVWVQVSEKCFNRILELWDDENQGSEPPIRGLLANTIPLNTGTTNAEVAIQLVDSNTRPTVTVKDEECSLYSEQNNGITIHRASEYSDLCR